MFYYYREHYVLLHAAVITAFSSNLLKLPFHKASCWLAHIVKSVVYLVLFLDCSEILIMHLVEFSISLLTKN